MNKRYFLIAGTSVISIFFLIPFELYFSAKEYWNWNETILLGFFAVGIVAYLLLLLVLAFFAKIHQRLFAVVSVLLFSIGIFVLLADVLAPLQTSLLDGAKLVSSEPLKYSILEVSILLLIFISIIKLGFRKILLIAAPISVIFLAIVLFDFGLIALFSKPNFAESSQSSNPSIEGNVYHILLDEMQTDAAMLHLQKTDIEKGFSGFTIYENNISNYLYTLASAPSFFTGTTYKDGDFEQWKEKFKTEGLLGDLYKKGYKITMYSAQADWANDFVSEFITLDDIYEQQTGVQDPQLKDFIQIWFARLWPNFLTNEALYAGSYLGRAVYKLTKLPAEYRSIPTAIEEGKEPFSSVLMFKKLIDDEKKRPPNGQYVYAHVLLPHGPYVLNEKCEYNPALRTSEIESYRNHAQCAFNLTIEFIDELKRLNRYDSSTIIIHADTGHGHRGFISKNGDAWISSLGEGGGDAFLGNTLGWTREQVLARSMAFLAIKPQGASEELSYSGAHSQLIDLYPSIGSLLDLDGGSSNVEGKSLFDKQFPNTRPATFYFWFPPGAKQPKIFTLTITNPEKINESELIVGSR